MLKIAFSWDDGAVEDLKIMDLSLKYSIPGIFFIPGTNSERSVMPKEDIKKLALNNFEVGAHTLSHSYLTEVSLQKATEELTGGKYFLEQLLGRDVTHFCFPGGKYNSELVRISKQYFKSARTADTGSIEHKSSFLVKPTFHFYDRGKKSLVFNGLKNSFKIFQLTVRNISSSGYFELINNILADLSRSDKTYYIIIWGHSWEIEEFQLWNKLEALFQNIKINYQESLFRYSDLIA